MVGTSRPHSHADTDWRLTPTTRAISAAVTPAASRDSRDVWDARSVRMRTAVARSMGRMLPRLRGGTGGGKGAERQSASKRQAASGNDSFRDTPEDSRRPRRGKAESVPPAMSAVYVP